MLRALLAPVLLTYTGIALCIQLIWRTISVPCTNICECVYIHLMWRAVTVPVYLHLVLRLHTADMADYHCARVLTSAIAFTYIWYCGLLLCPCTYIWYCVYTHLIWRTFTVPFNDIWYCVYIELIWRTITLPVYLHLVLPSACTGQRRKQLLVLFLILKLQLPHFSLTRV